MVGSCTVLTCIGEVDYTSWGTDTKANSMLSALEVKSTEPGKGEEEWKKGGFLPSIDVPRVFDEIFCVFQLDVFGEQFRDGAVFTLK